jgi:hypothetical protein
MSKVVSPICMSRDASGFFLTGTAPDDEFYKRITREEAEKVLRDRNCPEDLLQQIMSETRPGVVMC